MSTEDMIAMRDTDFVRRDSWGSSRKPSPSVSARLFRSTAFKAVCGLAAACLAFGALYATIVTSDDTPSGSIVHEGRPIANQMFGQCLISSTKPSDSVKKPAPKRAYVRTGYCDEEPDRILYFVIDNNKRVQTEDGRCLVPLDPKQEGSSISLLPCDKVNGESGANWQFGGSDNEQLLNGLGFCMDLEHQHSHGHMIQWRCKNNHQYKAMNQHFKFIE